MHGWQQRSYNTVKENRKCLQLQWQQRAKAEPELAPSLGWQGRPPSGTRTGGAPRLHLCLSLGSRLEAELRLARLLGIHSATGALRQAV